MYRSCRAVILLLVVVVAVVVVRSFVRSFVFKIFLCYGFLCVRLSLAIISLRKKGLSCS